MSDRKPFKRGGGPKALANALGNATKRTFGMRGFADGAIVRSWPEIVGGPLAKESIPDRIAFSQGKRNQGTLHLRVEPGGMAVELQHLTPLVIERVNGFFGFECVSRIAITQGPIPKRPVPKPLQPRVLSEEDEARVVAHANGIQDETLRETVRNLGRAMLSKPPKSSQ